MKTILLILALATMALAQTTNRLYVVIPTSVIAQTDPNSKNYNEDVVAELDAIGTPQGKYYATDHRKSNDGNYVLIEFNKVDDVDTVETNKINIMASPETVKLTADQKEYYKKLTVTDNKITEKKASGVIADSRRWKVYFENEKDVYDLLNGENWKSVEEVEDIGVEGKK